MAVQTSEFIKNREKIVNEIINGDLFGRTIYLLGSAEFGPTNQPVLCRGSAGIYRKFGKRGTLIEAFHMFKHVYGNNDVYLVKITGCPSKNYLNVNIEDGAIMHKGFIIESKDSNEIFNEVRINILSDSLVISFPKELNRNDLIYRYDSYPYIEAFADAINNEENGLLNVHYTVDPLTPTASAFYPCNPSYVYLCGGMCGLGYTKDGLYNYLENAYDALESLEMDFVIPVDAFMDDVYPDDMSSEETVYGLKYYQKSKDYLSTDIFGNKLSYLNQLINFCIRQLRFGVIIHGIIGFNKSLEYDNVYNESNDLTKMYIACSDYNYKLLDNPAYSFLVSIVGGDILYNHKYQAPGYLCYAAMCTKCMVTEGTTNLKISDSVSLYHEFEQEYLENLSDHGIVTFRHSVVFKQPVVYNGVTAFRGHKALSDDYKNFANVRMIQLAIAYVNRIFQFYVGHSVQELINENIISTDIDIILSNLQKRGCLSKYNFRIVPYYKQGEIKVYLTLETIFMIKPVTVCPKIIVEYGEEADIE